MPKCRMILLTASGLLLICWNASAQEKGQTGLTMAFPAAVGLMWHVSDRVALRPEVSFSWSSSSTTPADSPFTSSGSGTSYGVGLSGLFYVAKWEGLSAYVSPRFSYARTSRIVTTTISGSAFGGLDGGIRNPTTTSSLVTEGTDSSYLLSGSFGAQYSLSRKFGVFGEAGLAYSDTRSSTSTASTGSTFRAFGTRAGVGVLFYF